VKPLSLLIALLLVPALACSTAGLAESLVSPGGVLYQDIFSNPQSGWGEWSSLPGTANYSPDGAYHIVVSQPNVNIWTHPGLSFSNIHEEVSLMSATEARANRMGLICRLKDNQNFYFFVISADGQYGIGKVKDGQVSLLSGEKMQPNDSILTGSQVNRLRADCLGNVLMIYVNGTYITSVTDNDFTSGDVGILAGTFDQPGTDVYFDNFVVFKP
jgi:hypothetical protein